MNHQAIIQEREHIRKIHMEQAAKNRVFRKELQHMKDILDLHGEAAVLKKFGPEKFKLLEERPRFFYPGRERDDTSDN